MKRKSLLLVFFVLILLSSFLYLPASAAQSSALTCTMHHTVQRGETLTKIANKYLVSWRWLAVINKLSSDRVRAGQRLCVQLTDLEKVQAACTQTHIVKRGEDLSKIARLYGVTWQWLASINRLDDPNHIFAGNRLCVQTVTSTSTPSTPSPPNVTGVIPTFSIVSVEQNQTVTIQTYNFPTHVTLDARMGRMGTRGVNGILAGTIETGKSGSFIVTFDIPSALYGRSQIAIRLESPESDYYAYNWFYNRNAP
jgi:LysM repeat protein